LKKALRTSDLAKAAQISVQAVRNYEAWGFIPGTERTPHGYRIYTAEHLHALRVAKILIAGFGWKRSLHIMQGIHRGDLAAALVLIDAHHAEIHQRRRETEETLRILRTTSEELPLLMEGKARYRNGLHVSEAATLVGVRVSALRFWEEQGLLQPTRDGTSRYRIYDAEQLRKLQVVALLRKANYDFAAIRTVLDQLALGTPDQAVAAAENRLKELSEISRCCAEGTAKLWAYIESRSLFTGE